MTKEYIEYAFKHGDYKTVYDRLYTEIYDLLRAGKITYPESRELVEFINQMYDSFAKE